MKNTFRMLGVVACLFVVWMVARGTNGCAVPPTLPPPEKQATLTINYPNTPDFAGAYVLSGGHRLKHYPETGAPVDVVLTPDGSPKQVTIKWYEALEGLEPSGMLTIISSKNANMHAHRFYAVTNDPDPEAEVTFTAMCPCP